MSRVRCDSSRSVSASSAEVIDTLVASSSAAGLNLLAPDFKTLFLPGVLVAAGARVSGPKC